MTDDENVIVKVVRGTKGRIVGWLVYCAEHGYVDKPTPKKSQAMVIAQAHARDEHDANTVTIQHFNGQ